MVLHYINMSFCLNIFLHEHQNGDINIFFNILIVEINQYSLYIILTRNSTFFKMFR
jgi:hypothetical protein